MSDLHTLPIVGHLLKRLEINTQEELNNLDLNEVGAIMGVGRRKLEIIKSLQQSPSSQEETVEGHSDEQVEYRKPKREVPPRLCDVALSGLTVEFSARIKNKIAEHDIKTVGELEEYLSLVKIESEENFGRITYKSAIRALDDFYKSPSDFMTSNFLTVSGLIYDFMDRLDDARAKDMINKYYWEGKTLQEIGDLSNPIITRERVRQIIKKSISTGSERYRKNSDALLAPMYRHFAKGCGVASLSKVLIETGSESVGELILCASISGTNISNYPSIMKDGITHLDHLELKACKQEIRRNLGIRGRTVSVDEACARVRSLGYDYSDQEAIWLIENFLEVSIVGDRIWPPGKNVNTSFEEALRAFNHPITSKKFAAHLSSIMTPDVIHPNTVAVNFQRNPRIFKVNEHEYVHQDGLSLHIDQVNKIADKVLTHIPRNGDAVSLKPIIHRMGLDSVVNPYTVRDILIKRKMVRGWRSTCDVAYICDGTNRKTLRECIDEISSEFDQPFDNSDLIDKLVEDKGFKKHTIDLQFNSHSSIILYSVGESVHVPTVFGSMEKYKEVLENLYVKMPKNRILSAPLLNSLFPEYSKFVKDVGENVLWSVLRTHPKVKSKILGLLLWDDTMGVELTSEVMKLVYDKPIFSVSELSKTMQKFWGVTNRHLAYVLVREAVASGALVKHENDTYSRI